MGENETVRPAAEPMVQARREPAVPGRGPTAGPAVRGRAAGSRGSARRASVAIVTLALAWFLISWWALGSPVVDALGEAAGGVLAVLLVVSVIGSLRDGER